MLLQKSSNNPLSGAGAPPLSATLERARNIDSPAQPRGRKKKNPNEKDDTELFVRHRLFAFYYPFLHARLPCVM